MNEYEQVQKTADGVFKLLNESKLSGMTIYYMMKDITGMIEEQLRNPAKVVNGEGGQKPPTE